MQNSKKKKKKKARSDSGKQPARNRIGGAVIQVGLGQNQLGIFPHLTYISVYVNKSTPHYTGIDAT